MKNVRINNLIRKIAIIILFIMCFNIISPNCVVNAETYTDENGEPGGSLFQPIMDFLVFLADSVMNVLQHNFISLHDVVYSQVSAKSNGTFSWSWLGIALLGIIGIAYGIACIYTGGAALALGTVVTGIFATVGGIVVSAHAFGEISDLKAGEFDLPYIMYNPYTIFSGGVPALDINFVKPREPHISESTMTEKQYRYVIDYIDKENKPQNISEKYSEDTSIQIKNDLEIIDIELSKWTKSLYQIITDTITDVDGKKSENKSGAHKNFTKMTSVEQEVWRQFSREISSAKRAIDLIDFDSETEDEINEKLEDLNKKLDIAFDDMLEIARKAVHENIASNDIGDIVNHLLYSEYTVLTNEKIEAPTQEYTEKREYKSSAAILQSSIATWYKVLRRIALVGLLSVLVYVGIRMVISATAADMTKYKKMFLDWLVAVCLLFVLHYIMILILTVSTNLTDIFQKTGALNLTWPLPVDTKINDTLLTSYSNSDLDSSSMYSEYSNLSVMKDENGTPYPLWNGEFMGYIRLRAGGASSRNQLAYGLMYLVLVIYVCTFTFMYLRRVLYMAFLTMIAPLIALTYPLDKIKDGQAQAFGLWLREYIFNALIQPVHLIIYTMVISTVINLAVEHPVYALVALGFMLPAEKFIRSMFGFQKASTVDNPGGAFGGAALMGVVSSLSKFGKMMGKKKDDKSSEKIRTADKNGAPINIPDVDGVGIGDQGVATPRMANNTQLPDAEQIQRTTSNNANVDSDGYEYASNMFDQAEQARNTQANAAQQSNAQNNNQSTRNKPTIRNRFGNAMTSMANRSKNRILKAKPLRTVGRFTAMGAGAATLGMVGLAAGISSGEFGNVLKYTGAGIGVGGALGKSVGDFAMDKGSQIKEDFKEGFMGSEEYNNQKLDREYFNGQGYQEMLDNNSLMPNLSGPQRDQALRHEIEKYRSYGFADNKQIASCMKAGLSSEEGVCALQIAKSLSGKDLDSAGKEAYKAAYKRQLGGQFDSSKIDNIWKVIEANM